jgi:hypothetical protein
MALPLGEVAFPLQATRRGSAPKSRTPIAKVSYFFGGGASLPLQNRINSPAPLLPRVLTNVSSIASSSATFFVVLYVVLYEAKLLVEKADFIRRNTEVVITVICKPNAAAPRPSFPGSSYSQHLNFSIGPRRIWPRGLVSSSAVDLQDSRLSLILG